MIENEIRFEAITGQGSGGQYRNRRHCTIRGTHLPTGIVKISGDRSQAQNKKAVIKAIKEEVKKRKLAARAEKRKQARLLKIQPGKYIRTYDFKKHSVIDHRSGKRAPLDAVLTKGKLELLK